MDASLAELRKVQSNYEQRFNCLICWFPKLEMVYGCCQHRLCVDCLYDENGVIKGNLQRCPMCQQVSAFPVVRPDIPEDNIEIQKRLGVQQCENPGCFVTTWSWEMEDHLLECPKARKSRKSLKSSHSHSLNEHCGAVNSNTPSGRLRHRAVGKKPSPIETRYRSTRKSRRIASQSPRFYRDSLHGSPSPGTHT